MKQSDASALKPGDAVIVNYHGAKVKAVVVNGALADRWGETVLVRFPDDSVWAPHHTKVEAPQKADR